MHSRLTIRDFSMALALVLVCGFFSINWPALLHGRIAFTPFLGAENLSHLMTEAAITGTLAMGMLLIILPGHIDLSVGSGVGLLGGIAAVLVMQQHVPVPLALLIAFLAGVVLWSGMGALIVLERIPAFIITLGGLLVFKGLFWKVIDNSTVPVALGGQSNLYSLLTTYYVPPFAGLCLAGLLVALFVIASVRGRAQMRAHGFALEDAEQSFLKLFVAAQGVFLLVIVTNQFRGIPLPALILTAVTFVVHALTRHTCLGRYLYAIGGSEEAAIVSGVPVTRTLITAFAVMGGVVAVTGFMQTAYIGSSTTTVGELMELDAIAACVIGGVSLKGGRGSVTGVLFGTLIIACLLNGMTLMAVAPWKKLVARGIVLVLAVWMDVRMARQKA